MLPFAPTLRFLSVLGNECILLTKEESGIWWYKKEKNIYYWIDAYRYKKESFLPLHFFST
jgi:hypothetical protein